MASHEESDSDSELIFEDAVEDIGATSKKDNQNSIVGDNKSTSESRKSKTENSASESKDKTSFSEQLTTGILNLNLDNKDGSSSVKHSDEMDQPEKGNEKQTDDDHPNDDEETESCSESDGEFDEETINELMGEDAEEKKDSSKLPKEEAEGYSEKGEEDVKLPDEEEEGSSADEEEEEEANKIDDEAIKERDATLTEEEKQELRDKAQDYKTEGNKIFKEGNYLGSISEYTSALQTCPLCYAKERSIMYSNRGAAKLHLEKHQAAIDDCTKAVELNPNYLKALLRRAELYEKTDKLDEALSDYTKVLEMDPSQHSAREAAMRLPDQIKERNEKMKDEMMGKLKDLGNMILKPFGLSTNNFNLQQDPNTGGYSVNFSQGAPSQ